MWWKKQPKELYGISTIARFFKINAMDFLTWHREMISPPPMWKENAVWHCEAKAMKAWLKNNGLLPKKASLLEIIKAERNLKNEKRRVKNNENWQRTITRHNRRDWKPDGKIRKGRMW